MISFPNCKINLGLNVVQKRTDGFHDLETVFYPINWRDALEVIENQKENPFLFSSTGLYIEGNTEDNLIYKAWKLISAKKKLPHIKVHLHKNIPMGAGIGGGSSDAAYFINLLNAKFDLNFSMDEKHALASQLGSDCAFFLNNKPLMAQGTGNIFTPVTLNLSSFYILLVYPAIHSNTKDAFTGLQPKKPSYNLKETIENLPVHEWRNILTNDFETTIFTKYPQIQDLKEKFYSAGALYASMSGSGSAVYGIFESKPVITFNSSYQHYLQIPNHNFVYH